MIGSWERTSFDRGEQTGALYLIEVDTYVDTIASFTHKRVTRHLYNFVNPVYSEAISSSLWLVVVETYIKPIYSSAHRIAKAYRFAETYVNPVFSDLWRVLKAVAETYMLPIYSYTSKSVVKVIVTFVGSIVSVGETIFRTLRLDYLKGKIIKAVELRGRIKR